MPLAQFRIALSPDPDATVVEVNGQTVPGVRAVALQSLRQAGETPRLILELAGDGVLEGDGIVEVQRPTTAADDGDAVARFLAGIDPAELSRQALERADWGDADVITLAVDILREAAEAAR